jgi:hypothetical protein
MALVNGSFTTVGTPQFETAFGKERFFNQESEGPA